MPVDTAVNKLLPAVVHIFVQLDSSLCISMYVGRGCFNRHNIAVVGKRNMFDFIALLDLDLIVDQFPITAITPIQPQVLARPPSPFSVLLLGNYSHGITIC